MRKNTKIALAFIGSAFLLLAGFASCKADDGDDEKEAEIESVSISAGASSISANGSTTLTATPSISSTADSSEVTYSWSVSENTGGGTLSDSTSSTATLTGANTTASDVEVTVTVSATYNGKSVSSSCKVTILAAGKVLPTGITLSSSSISLEITDNEANPTSTLTATLAPSNITSGYDTITWTSSDTSVATVSGGVVTAVKAGIATITAKTWNGDYSATCAVTVTSTVATNVIKASDTPIGFATAGTFTSTPTKASTGSYSNPVTTRDGLISAISKGGLIYIKGMIDMTDTGSGTMIPTVSDGSYVYPATLDSFVSSNTSYESYSAWKSAYISKCETDTDDESYSLCSISTLYKAYKSMIQLNVKSNTTIIGLDSSSGIIGGTISISSVRNVAIRNIILQDAYDPFPHHEENDGWNSQYDGITVQGTCSGIWIDHCTFQDSLNGSDSTLDYVTNASGEKEHWNPYDGQCDIKGTISSMTVSYCKFMNHDKTMLLCSGTSDTGTKNVTLAYNYFYGCKQRLPMVGIANLHTFNNYFAIGDGTYSSNDYAIGLRYSAQVVSENNCFSSWIKRSYKDQGIKSIFGVSAMLYSSGDTDNSSKGNVIDDSYQTSTRSDLFTVDYSYSLKESSELETYIPANAGAGVWTVSE